MTPEPAVDQGPADPGHEPQGVAAETRVRFTIWGREAMQKQVTQSGKSGRVYLPRHWVGSRVVVVRMDD